AAGAVPLFPPASLALYPDYRDYVTPPDFYEKQGGKTPNRVLIETHTIEGIARFARHPAGPSCNVNYRSDAPGICTKSPRPDPFTCQRTLFDSDWLSEGKQPYDAQHLTSPLRLARRADVRVVDAMTLAKAWEPRIAGTPLVTNDTGAWKAD